ncbi:hypothetical protein [Nocardia salmonicida]|uniref:hypothetical protein n=1 Tax=Nocardia salmonicida TaxID=53431 RepID=UPI0033CBCBD5
MSDPKPLKKACIPEIEGWSGLFGARPWVAERFCARSAELARGGGFRKKQADEPDQWNQVTRLYASYVDPFARFSGNYAAAVKCLRPRELPAEAYGWLRPLGNRVPPAVRAVMAGTVDGQLGGLIESAATADQFLNSTDEYRTRYGFVAGHAYLTILRERAEKLRDTGGAHDSAIEAIEATIAEYGSHFGEPDAPLRKPTEVERARAHAMLMAKVDADPTLLDKPHFGAAYERAARTLLRWIVLGREDLHGGILYKALEWEHLDECRRQAKFREKLVFGVMDDGSSALLGVSDGSDSATEVRARLEAARATLKAHAEPSVADPAGSWEKEFAARLLDDGNALVFDAYGDLADLVAAAWRYAVVSGVSRPPSAITFDPETAALYIHILLAVALSSGPPRHRAAAHYARRLRKVQAALEAHREKKGADEETES